MNGLEILLEWGGCAALVGYPLHETLKYIRVLQHRQSDPSSFSSPKTQVLNASVNRQMRNLGIKSDLG